MFIGLSLVLGLLTDWWWLPASFGVAAEAIHYGGSRRYRQQVHHQKRATIAVVLSVILLTALCLGAFWIGHEAVAFFQGL